MSIFIRIAEAATATEAANALITKFFNYIVNPAIKLAIAAGLFFFFYTIIRRVLWERGKTDSFGWKEGRGGVMVWGLLGLFIMIAAAGLIGMLKTGILKIGNTVTGSTQQNPVLEP